MSMTSDKGFVGETFISNGFRAIDVDQHIDLHEKLTAFLSMSCHCIFKKIFCIITPHTVHP